MDVEELELWMDVIWLSIELLFNRLLVEIAVPVALRLSINVESLHKLLYVI